jgi:hypothetical protein
MDRQTDSNRLASPRTHPRKLAIRSWFSRSGSHGPQIHQTHPYPILALHLPAIQRQPPVRPLLPSLRCDTTKRKTKEYTDHHCARPNGRFLTDGEARARRGRGEGIGCCYCALAGGGACREGGRCAGDGGGDGGKGDEEVAAVGLHGRSRGGGVADLEQHEGEVWLGRWCCCAGESVW